MRGEIFAASPIVLQSRCQRVPNEPIPTYGHSWPQHQIVCLKLETDREGINGEMVIGGRYVTRRVVLTPGAEYSATGVSLTALMDRVHSDGATLPGWKWFLLMPFIIFVIVRHFWSTIIRRFTQSLYGIYYLSTWLHIYNDHHSGCRHFLITVWWRPGDPNWVNFKIHVEFLIKQVWTWTLRPNESQCEIAIGGHHHANLEAVIMWAW